MAKYVIGLAWAELKRRLLELPNWILPRAFPACLGAILLLLAPSLSLGSNSYTAYVGPGTPFTLNAALSGFRPSAIQLYNKRLAECPINHILTAAYGGGTIPNTWYFCQSGGNDSTNATTLSITAPGKSIAKANQLTRVAATCNGSASLGNSSFTLPATSSMTSIGAASSSINQLFAPSGLLLVGGWTGITSGATTLSTSSFTINLQSPVRIATATTGLASTGGTVYLAIQPNATSPWNTYSGTITVNGQPVFMVPVTYTGTTGTSLTGCTTVAGFNMDTVPSGTEIGLWVQSGSTYTLGYPVTYTGAGTGSFTGCTCASSASLPTGAPIAVGGNMNILFAQGNTWTSETTTHSPADDGEFILASAAGSGTNTVTLDTIPGAMPYPGQTVSFTTNPETQYVTTVAINTGANTCTITLGQNLTNTHAAGTGITWTGLSSLHISVPNVTIGEYDTTGQSYDAHSSARPVFSAYSGSNLSWSSANTRGDTAYRTFSAADTTSGGVAYVSEIGDYYNPATVSRRLTEVYNAGVVSNQVDRVQGGFAQPACVVSSVSGGPISSSSSATITIQTSLSNYPDPTCYGATPAALGFGTSGTLYFGGLAIAYTGTSGATFTGCSCAALTGGNTLTLQSGNILTGGTLYWHPQNDSSPVASQGSTTSGLGYQAVHGNGVSFLLADDVDGTRLHGVVIVGYGAKPSLDKTPGGMRNYVVECFNSGTNSIVFSDVHAAIADNHDIGHVASIYSASFAYPNPIGALGYGGNYTPVRCTCRLTQTQDGAFVAYSPYGGYQVLLWQDQSDCGNSPIGLQPGNVGSPFVAHTGNIAPSNFNTYTSGATSLTLSAPGAWPFAPFLAGQTLNFTGGTGTEIFTVTGYSNATGVLTGYVGSPGTGLQYTNHTGITFGSTTPWSGQSISYLCPFFLSWYCSQPAGPFNTGNVFGSPDFCPVWNQPAQGVNDTALCRGWVVGEYMPKRPPVASDQQFIVIPLTAGSQGTSSVTVSNVSDLGTYFSSAYVASWCYLSGGSTTAFEQQNITSMGNSGGAYTGVVTFSTTITGSGRTEMWIPIGRWPNAIPSQGSAYSTNNLLYSNCWWETYVPFRFPALGNFVFNNGTLPNSSTAMVNCTEIFDFSQATNNVTALYATPFNYSAGQSAPTRWHSRIHLVGTIGKMHVGIDQLPSENSSAGPMSVFNSILTAACNGDGPAYVGLGNVDANQDGNAYSGFASQNGTYSGWSGDSNYLNVPNMLPPLLLSEPDTGLNLALTYAQEQSHLLPGGYTLQYDANWAPRPTTPQRGPYENSYGRIPYVGSNQQIIGLR